MTDFVDRTLKRWRQVPFQWGFEDCLISIADYVKECTGKDYGDIFRGTYSDEAGAMEHVKKFGGEINLIERSGLERVAIPQRGDIMLVDLRKPIGAICTGQGAAMRMLRGVTEIDLKHVEIIAVWKVPQCRQ